MIDRLSSGNQRLDSIFDGGLLRHAINLVIGVPGSGKTILSQQYVFHNATAERPSLYLSTVTEPLDKILRYGETLDFFDPWIYVEHLQRSASNCAEQLEQSQLAYETQLDRTRADYDSALAEANDRNAALTEEYIAVALRAISGPSHTADVHAAGRVLGRVLLVRPDVSERFGAAPGVDLARLLEWASYVGIDEPHVSELAIYRTTYARLAKRADGQAEHGDSVTERAAAQLTRVQRAMQERLGRVRGRR